MMSPLCLFALGGGGTLMSVNSWSYYISRSFAAAGVVLDASGEFSHDNQVQSASGWSGRKT